MCRVCRERECRYKDMRRLLAPEVMPHRKKRRKYSRKHVKGCEHDWVGFSHSRYGVRSVYTYVCNRCGKRKWGW